MFGYYKDGQFTSIAIGSGGDNKPILRQGTRAEFDAIEDKSQLNGMLIDITDEDSEGTSLTIDEELDLNSENALSNKAISNAFNNSSCVLDIPESCYYTSIERLVYIYFSDTETEGDGSQEHPFTISQFETFFKSLPYNLGNHVIRMSYVGESQVNLNIGNIINHTNGYLWIDGKKKHCVISDRVILRGSNFRLNFYEMLFNTTGDIWVNDDVGLIHTGNLELYLSGCEIIQNSETYCVCAGKGSIVDLSSCTFTYTPTSSYQSPCIICSGGIVYVYNCTINNYPIGYEAKSGIIYLLNDNITTSGVGTLYKTLQGGRIYKGAQTSEGNY